MYLFHEFLLIVGMLLKFSRVYFGGSCMTPLTPAANVIKGLTLQLLSHSVCISGSYLSRNLWIGVFGNMSLEFVHFINYMVFGEEGMTTPGWKDGGAGLAIIGVYEVAHDVWPSMCMGYKACAL